MKGTFRLTGAEFKKIFKRPSVFIMALILIVTIFASLYIYKPVNAPDLTVNYNQSKSDEYYNTFYKEDLSNTEKGINQIVADTDKIISYHKLNASRNKNLLLYYNDVLTAYDNLNFVVTNNTAYFEEKNTKFNEFKVSLEHFITYFDNSFDEMTSYDHIQLTKDNQFYIGAIDNFRDVLEKSNNAVEDSVVNIIKVNDYLEKLEEDYNNAINYTTPTLLGIAKDLDKNYYEFNTRINQEHSILSAIESKRKDLLKIVEEYTNYYTLLIDNEFPIVTIDNTVKNDLTEALDILTRILNRLTTQGKLSDYTSIQREIANSNIINYLVNVSENNSIKLISVNSSLVTNLEKAQKKVIENQDKIKQNIDSHKDDDGIKNIQFDITEYKLLADTYSTYINDKLTLEISKEYKYEDFIKLYGYDFNKFNEYQYNERIAINKYYLENNIYANSYINNFSFGQNSSTKTNVYDFMFFVLEICAIVITVFAMMQICNLITNETESGTITLLLVRPYKRGKVLTAKLLTTIFFVLTFMLFCSVIAFAGGVALYGLESRSIIAVFNGTTAFTISPMLLMVINIVTLVLDIIFFVILALMIATIFKNYAGSITACLIILILHYVLNVLFGGAFWYSFMPGINLHLFKFFGNNFVSADTGLSFASIFSAPIQSSMSILYSGILILAYTVISLLISYTVFKNRDY